jgi:hypothetical protein
MSEPVRQMYVQWQKENMGAVMENQLTGLERDVEHAQGMIRQAEMMLQMAWRIIANREAELARLTARRSTTPVAQTPPVLG